MDNQKSINQPRIKMMSSAGSSFFNWMAVLAENNFKVGFKYLPRAIMVTFATIILYPFVLLEKIIFDRKIKKTKIISPVFIIGHMRSGTTFLHHIMSKDNTFTYASTTEAIFPWVFLLLKKPLKAFMNYVLPQKRPMDGMSLTENLPQEEEFAIANLCLYSPNNGAYFPQNMEKFYEKYTFFEGVRKRIIKRWKKTYKYYLQKIVYKSNGKRILSKSIVNSCRIKLLLELFPDAKFIFIYRNPYKVFLSSKKLYKKFIFQNMSYQDIEESELERVILKLAKKGYKKYFEEKELVKKGNLIEIRFEDFIKNPMDYLEKLYKILNLEGFDKSKNNFIQFLKAYENYKADKYTIDPEIKNKVYKELKFIFDKYGYEI